MKDKEKIDILLTDAIEQNMAIHTLIDELNEMNSSDQNPKHEQIQSEFHLAQHAHHLLKASPALLAPSDLEKRMMKRIKRGRRHYNSSTQNSFSIFSIIYVIAVILLMIFCFFQFRLKQKQQNYYQTPLRPLPTINSPLTK